MSFASDTNVSVEKSRAELETVLRRYGSDAFGYMSEKDKALIQFKSNGKFVRFILPLPDPAEKRFWLTPARGNKRTPAEAEREWEQECRSAWRALLLCVKAKLEAVARKITTFDEEFLAHIVLPDGSTVGQQMMPLVNDAYSSGKMPTFTLALPARRAP